MTSPTTSYLRPLVALVALVAAMGALLIAYTASPTYAAPVCSTTSGTTTCTFSSTGAEDTFVVPQGVSSVDVVATGAPGAVAFNSGDNTPAPPGLGAVVSGNLTVTPGQTLYVNVGGAPTGAGTSDCGGPGSVDCVGGFNGGGETGPGGGAGGGASDVRTQPRTVPLASDDSRLIVAAGGGGAGIGGNCTPPGSSSDVGGSGGDAGSDGGNGESCQGASGGTGGKAGTQTAGGLGGVPGGERGSLGQGGSGGSLGDLGSGGGGGGGYYGGGGGGGQTETGDFFSGSGGGGGGSNLVPQGGSATLTQDTNVPPSVTISYRTGGVGEPPPTEQPQSKEDCKKGGWKEFGFKNQGQCIKAVNHPS
jgi:hypothetical protein